MKTCKFCKHGYMYYSQCRGLPPCVYCYLKYGKYPEKKAPDDTCTDWEPNKEEEE